MATEPIDPFHPLLRLPKVILSPQVGSANVETRVAMMELALANLTASLTGRPPAAVVN